MLDLYEFIIKIEFGIDANWFNATARSNVCNYDLFMFDLYLKDISGIHNSNEKEQTFC